MIPRYQRDFFFRTLTSITIFPLQIFFSFFKTLVGKEIAVELKNDVSMTGTLVSVDQYLNIKIANAQVVNSEKHPQLVSFDISLCFAVCFMW